MIARLFFAICALALLTGPAPAQETFQTTTTIRDHKFEPAEIKVPANKKIMLKVINEDATSEEFHSDSLKTEKVIAGKGQATIRFNGLKPGRYDFMGEYHEATAKGALIAE